MAPHSFLPGRMQKGKDQAPEDLCLNSVFPNFVSLEKLHPSRNISYLSLNKDTNANAIEFNRNISCNLFGG